ncbi:MAG TPA: hypothetical protein VHP33_17045 [Polyangiaceae bacterium]|nr:hypothetical protein [Polyangiaceae bacterium]
MSEETKDQAEPLEPTQPSEAEAKPEAAESEAAAQPEAAAASKASVQEPDEDGAVLDAAGRERPRFLLGFPEHPDLARLAAAFEAGNYALVRAEAERVAERAENPAVRDAALELRRRIDPDPLAKYLLALTAALLLSLSYFAYHH